MSVGNDVGSIFEQAIADGHLKDFLDSWGHLACVYYGLFRTKPTCLQDEIEEALAEMEYHRGVANLTPREYERLFQTLEALRDAHREFGEAMHCIHAKIFPDRPASE